MSELRGRWPDDLLDNVENKHYADFGCSYQNNLAAQIDNPADLLGPRKQTPIDAENRINAIDVYQNRGVRGEFEIAVGPNLTTIGDRLGQAAIARTLQSPTAPMPSYANYRKTNPEQFNKLVQYVASLRSDK